MPKVSLIVPVYNKRAFLDKFFDCLRDQTFDDFEAIFIDDGCTDGSEDALDRFAQTDGRTSIIHQRNAGVSAARNRGIEIAQGDYLFFADADDWLEATAFEDIWIESSLSRSDIIFFDHIEIRDKTVERIESFPSAFISNNRAVIEAIQFGVNCSGDVAIASDEFSELYKIGAAPWRGVFRTEMVKQHALRFDPELKLLGEDVLFLMNALEHAKSVAHSKRAVYNHKIYGKSLSQGYDEDYLQKIETILEKERAFIHENCKGEFFVGSFYLRTLLYIHLSMKRFFLNRENPLPENMRFELFEHFLETYNIKRAIENAPLRYLKMGKRKMGALALRHGSISLYWRVCKLLLAK